MDNLLDLYGNSADSVLLTKRILNIKAQYEKIFGGVCRLYSSPGRIEILGNHTDHNKGMVLVGAINRDIIAAAGRRNDGRVIIISKGFDEINIDVNDLHSYENEKGKSVSLIRGVLKGLKDKGCKTGGISAVIESNIFKGAGVSSSAAYEVLLTKIFSDLYDCGLSPLDAAKISQYAEKEYFGKPCGLLDQCGIAFGGVNRIDFRDTEKPLIKSVDFDLKEYGIVITNCGGDHISLTPQYAAVKDEMKAVAGYFGKEFLREVKPEVFYQSVAKIKNSGISGRAILRAVHFFNENERVDKAAKALEKGNVGAFLKCVNESGESSYKLLQNCYAEGDVSQGIPLALEMAKKFLKGKGAVRVHGGGFAGTTLAFVPQAVIGDFIEYMKNIFGVNNVINAEIRRAGTAEIKV
jgi:galactokinase